MEGEYYNTKASVQEYIKMAEGLNGKALIEKLKVHLPKASSVLELGTGPGSDWRILNEFYELVGSDNSKEFLEHLNHTFPKGQFVLLDAVTLEIDQQFDSIYSNKVLHHLSDDELKQSIKRQSSILKDNGLVCHSFWKGEGTETFKGLFVNSHLETVLQEFFKVYFEVILLESYQEFDADDSILLIARKK